MNSNSRWLLLNEIFRQRPPDARQCTKSIVIRQRIRVVHVEYGMLMVQNLPYIKYIGLRREGRSIYNFFY